MEQTPLTSLPAPDVAPRKKGPSAGTVLLVVAGLVAVAGVTFAVGRMTAPTSGTAGGRSVQGGGAPGGSFAPGAGGFPSGVPGAGSITIEGTVESVGNGRITLKLSSGSTMDITTDSSTKYHRQAAASSSDVTTGSQVQVLVSGLRGISVGRPDASGAPGLMSPDATAAPQTATDITVVAP